MSKNIKNYDLKLGIFLTYRSPEEGGGFTITNDILNEILIRNYNKKKYKFIILNDKEKILEKIITRSGYECYKLKENIRLLRIKNFVFSLMPILLKIYNYLGFNQFLNLQKKYKIDLVWFLSAEYYYPLFSKYVSTVWDLQHLTHSQFPEIGSFFRKIYRRIVIKNFLTNSYKIITGSSLLVKIISKNYHLKKKKIIFNQHPTPQIFLKHKKDKKNIIIKIIFYIQLIFGNTKIILTYLKDLKILIKNIILNLSLFWLAILKINYIFKK